MALFLQPCCANFPPKFLHDGITSEAGGEVVVRLKEGSDTPPGTKILHLRGFDRDGDPLTFGVKGSQAVIHVENEDNNEASVFIVTELDAESQTEYQLVLTLTDGHLGVGNFITQSLLILVEDVNDNPPIFQPYSNTITVEEHSGTKIIGVVEAIDRDSGIFGQVIYELREQDGFDEPFKIQTADGKGILTLVEDLDYETRPVYQLEILARDRANFGQANTATAAILIKVKDIADQPPEFVTVPSVTRVSEDVPKFDEVLRVRAVDGDRDIGNPIVYSIVSGPSDIFAINPDTGIVYTQVALDRESPRSSNGAFILGIEASEIGGIEEPSVLTEVTIIIEDVNDESPEFRSSNYMAEIGENSPKGSMVNFLDSSAIPEVFDHDQGTNGTFNLSIEGDGGIFEVTPKQGINEASFMIRVKDPSQLDFEKVKVINFTLVATEIVEADPHQNRASVTIHIRDVNDNYPAFNEDTYEVEIPENIDQGSTIAWIRATDQDSGSFGTSGIRYTRLSGPLAKHLDLNPQSGIITLGDFGEDANGNLLPSPFDREKTETHYLTVEARDDEGSGNRNAVELTISLLDVNDHPPRFLQDFYQAQLPENSNGFSVPFFLQAFDNDQNGTENAQIRYRIVKGDAGGNFSIDSITGEVRPSGLIDYELMREHETGERYFKLLVRAYDLGNPPLFSDVPLQIFVSDQNDNAPIFEQSLYRINVDEDIQGGTKITEVKARDRDGSSPNNLVIYRIITGAKDKFVVDSETGVISVSLGANLDPDLTSPRTHFYFLEIAALDGGFGSNQLSSIAEVNVTITDVNNKNPYFEQPEAVNIMENSNPGAFVTRVVALDPDTSAKLTYSLDSNKSEAFDENDQIIPRANANVSELFELDANTGDLRVIGRVDREMVARIKLFIRVEDVNAVRNPPQIAFTSLPIIINDVNDNSPEFEDALYIGSVLENSPPGTPVLTVKATDKDENKTITYALEGPSSLSNFLFLDANHGDILVKQAIDRESVGWLNFTVRASDSGFPPRSTFVDVSLLILDENDNTPSFKDEEVTRNLTVAEDTPLGTIIARIQAHDEDSGEFGKVTYFLDKRSPAGSAGGGKFRIHPDTGEISVAEALDREEEDAYNLIVQAYDNYQFGFTTGDSRHAFIQLKVHVLDVNDERPVFETQSSEQCALVTEFHEMSEPVMTIRAFDGDDPETDNARLSFSIQSGNSLDLFHIVEMDHMTAKVFPQRSLKGFYGNYTLSILARDRGYPSNSAANNFHICVQDFNDNSPQIISPPANYTIRIAENASIGAEVTQIRAVDTDTGSNGMVRYRIRKDPLGNFKSFQINPENGQIVLAKPLDRERQKVYGIRVEAFDLGTPTSLQTDLDIVIYVKNINDHEPHFLVDEFSVNFTEHKPPGAERNLIVGTVDQDDEDYDSERLEVCYFIVGGDGIDFFEILPLEHEILTTVELDREAQDSFSLVVKATEECLYPPEHLNASFDPLDDSLLSLNIQVTDIDDHPPTFVKKVFTGGISTNMDFGDVFATIKAVDADLGGNAEIRYSLDGQIIPSSSSEGLENVRKPPFLVNPDTGDLVLNFDPQKGMKGYFDFGVRAYDRAGHVAKAKVQIYLLREDQRVKFVMRSQPAEIRPRIDQFLKVVSDVTGAIVNADGFKVHENSDGTVDKTKTDVLLHFVNPSDNSVLEVVDVLRLIDYRTEELVNIFREFNVINTEGVDPNFVRSAALVHPMMSWVMGLCVFLTILLVVVLILCCCQRERYNRKLRAATTLALDESSPDAVLNKRELVPNTNRHAMEGSNPVWMTGVGYENYEYPKDADDAAMVQKRNNLNRIHLDSLDANVLNESLDSNAIMTSSKNRSREADPDDDDVGYAASHFSNGGSTIRVGSFGKLESPLSASSGRGSGNSRRFSHNDLNKGGPGGGIYSKNMSIASLFPSQMPPIEKLQPAEGYGNTTYDEDDIPRTEL
ncbi:hypothetical protein TCAL_08438 [Tigriopus californicus]|uniref:Cadherin domain-containing protein n=1 Tax=Tigriopus californicus TaxID=6832 RepID=A0A553P2H7_TIGCA|nr:cadherin-23-like [Tigriopus californicus]TRY71883.1 hypothetical protein TCAL_08438 [Tigriopus californicus]